MPVFQTRSSEKLGTHEPWHIRGTEIEPVLCADDHILGWGYAEGDLGSRMDSKQLVPESELVGPSLIEFAGPGSKCLEIRRKGRRGRERPAFGKGLLPVGGGERVGTRQDGADQEQSRAEDHYEWGMRIRGVDHLRTGSK